MRVFAAGGSYYGLFTTSHPTTGAATDADSLPTATATTNGTDDGTFTLAVTKLATGRYKITGTVPAGYSRGDDVQISVAATVAGTACVGVVDAFVVGDVLEELHAAKAAAFNKQKIDQDSGDRTIYDDDGTTELITTTVTTDTEGRYVTETPS